MLPPIKKNPFVANGLRPHYGAPAHKMNGSPRGSEDDGENSILVAVRIRPLSENEMSKGERDTLRAVEGRVVVVLDPREDSEQDYLRAHRSKERRYAFDVAFGQSSDQHEVFVGTAQKLLPSILEGYNASVFAYGATGAGKTHTMLGDMHRPGIMVRTIDELFERMQKLSHGGASGDKVFRVSLSYMEVYNENVRDLLDPNTPNLEVREDPVKGVVVAGLTQYEAESCGDIMELLHAGNQNRTVEPTDRNRTSSRSHAILQIRIEGRDRLSDVANTSTSGCLSLIDLAGSERAATTNNKGIRLVEGANINRSLLALANCINRLADRHAKRHHVPYRDSKLTRILKDSFGGNSKTVMITNVSPSSAQYEETLNTLKYANRAKNIRTKVTKNVKSVDEHVAEYQRIIHELRSEVSRLQEQLQEKESPVVPVQASQRNMMESQRHRTTLDTIRKDAIDTAIAETNAVHKRKQAIVKELWRVEENILRTQYQLFKARAVVRRWDDDVSRGNAGASTEPRMVKNARMDERRLSEEVWQHEDKKSRLKKKLHDLENPKAEGLHLIKDAKNEQLEAQIKIHKLELENLELRWSQRMHNNLIKYAYKDDGTSGLNEMERILENQAAAVFSSGGRRSPLASSRSQSPLTADSFRIADVAEEEARVREEKLIERTLKAQKEGEPALPSHLGRVVDDAGEVDRNIRPESRPLSAHHPREGSFRDVDNRRVENRPTTAEEPGSRSASRKGHVGGSGDAGAKGVHVNGGTGAQKIHANGGAEGKGARANGGGGYKIGVSKVEPYRDEGNPVSVRSRGGASDDHPPLSHRDGRVRAQSENRAGEEDAPDGYRRYRKYQRGNYRARYQGRRGRMQEHSRIPEVKSNGSHGGDAHYDGNAAERFRAPQHREGFGFGVQGKSYADGGHGAPKKDVQKERLARLNKRMGRR